MLKKEKKMSKEQKFWLKATDKEKVEFCEGIIAELQNDILKYQNVISTIKGGKL